MIVYAPICREKQKELAQRVASLHAQTVIAYLKNMSCPGQQKLQLIERIKQEYSCKRE